MKFRLTAFGLHLLGSACALTLVLGGLYFGWYGWPGWYLVEVGHVVTIVVLVDIVLGPTLTLIVANPGKARRTLARDITVIATVQLIALGYAAVTLWGGRPLYYPFSVNRLEVVQASDLHDDEIAAGRRLNPDLAPHWYSRPRWIWAPLPEDPKLVDKILNGAVFGGSQDVVDMPRYFKSWQAGLPTLRSSLQALADVRDMNKAEKAHMRGVMVKEGLNPDERNAIVMWGDVRRVLVVFNLETMQMRSILKITK
jgi:hypothetical protein